MVLGTDEHADDADGRESQRIRDGATRELIDQDDACLNLKRQRNRFRLSQIQSLEQLPYASGVSRSHNPQLRERTRIHRRESAGRSSQLVNHSRMN